MDIKINLKQIKRFLDVAAIVAVILFIHVNMSRQLKDPDIWLHLKTGQLITETRAIPHTDPYSLAFSGKEWIDHSWLAQVIFYLVFNLGGVNSLIFFSSGIVILSFIFLLLSFFKPKKDATFIVGLLFLATAASSIRFNIRPEIFSVLFLSIYLFILTRYSDSKFVFLLPVIQILWVNTHGFFPLGNLILAAFLLSELAKRKVHLPWEWNNAGKFSDKAFLNLVFIFILCGFANLANPYGLNGLLYPLKIMLGSGDKLGIFYKHIQELAPVYETSLRFGINMTMYYILIFVSLFSFLINFRRINITHLCIWIILVSASLKVTRNITYFSLIAFIASVDNLEKVFDIDTDKLKRVYGKIIYAGCFSAVILAGIWTGIEIKTLAEKKTYLYSKNSKVPALLGVNTDTFPVKAVDFILTNGLAGNIFNLFDHGHYLIYRLYPKYKVFIDGRTELYENDFFENYLRFIYLDKTTIDKTVKNYNINLIVLHGDNIGSLANYFYNDLNWKLIFFGDSLIFLKNTPENSELIDKFKIDLDNYPSNNEKIVGCYKDAPSPEPYIRRGWVFYHLGIYSQALNQAKMAIRLKPDDPRPYCIAVFVYLKRGDMLLAYENLKKAYNFGPRDNQVLLCAGKYFLANNKTEPALLAYKQFVKNAPYSPDGYYHLGLAYTDAGKHDLAIECFKKAAALNPYAHEYYRKLGELLVLRGNYHQAESVYTQALRLGINPSYFQEELSKLQEKKSSNPPSETDFTPKNTE